MTFLDLLKQNFPSVELREAEPMANHTSFRIGGPAVMLFPENPAVFADLYRFCRRQNKKPLILGAGSNILAPDEGLQQPVLCTKKMSGIWDRGDGIIEAEAGISMAKLACFARDRGLGGLEFAHGIPGTAGGGVYMNAGAYDGEMRQIVHSVTAMLPDGSLCEMAGEDLEFSYRSSVFQKNNGVILKICIRLQPEAPEKIAAKMKELAEKRIASQPLDLPSAGSAFKRPRVGFAAALIDEAGLKGVGIGKAAVSEKHAGFVVNLGGATAADVRATLELIQKRVKENSGIELEPEVRIW